MALAARSGVLVVLAIAVAGAGCTLPAWNVDQADAGVSVELTPRDASARAPSSSDAGLVGQPDVGVTDSTWPLAQTHRLTTGSVQAVQLATNDGVVFGMTDHNGIWTFAPGDTAVRMIVPPGDTMVYPGDWGSRFVVSGTELYWLDRAAGALHRVGLDGTGDQILAAGLGGPDTLAVDANNIYWSELNLAHQGEGIIRSLPRNAAPGDPPVTLVAVGNYDAISSLDASGGALYWTSFISSGSTMYFASLTGASTDALLHGGNITQFDAQNPYGVRLIGGHLFYGSLRNPSTTELFDNSAADGSSVLLSILPIDVRLAGLAVTDEWLIVTGGSRAGTELYVAPRWGAGLVMIAKGLQTPAILGPAGITFVDASGALVFINLADLGYVGAGTPAPP